MFISRNSAIAVLDSGVGGLTLLKNLRNKYPNEDYIYLADNQYMPYGNKRSRFLKLRLLDLCNYLIDNFNIKLIILACNTASISALQFLKDNLNIPVYGLDLNNLVASLQYNVLIKDNSHINVDDKSLSNKYIDKKSKLQNTDNVLINSKQLSDKLNYTILCTKLSSKGYNNLNAIPCSRLAKTIEYNIFDTKTLTNRVKHLFKNQQISDNIILGCTHYELISDIFNKVYPSKNFINPCKRFVDDFVLLKPSLSTSKGDLLILATIPTKSYIDKLWKIYLR